MKKVARFEKVSYSQFEKDIKNIIDDTSKIKEIYDNIILPKRATSGSAGYDFFLPFDLKLEKNQSIMIPTGIRCKIEDGWVLNIFPRSGLGFKYQMMLSNTVGIIDSDYYNALNEGHIIIKIVNKSIDNKIIEIEKNKGFAQGIFFEFGITYDDDTCEDRIGGFGSTTK